MRTMFRVLAGCLALFSAAAALGEEAAVPTTGVSLDIALADARAVAARYSNMRVMRVAGESMLPFFGDGSVVVVKRIDVAKLRTGMVVVYTNRFGETVAHRLVETTEGGWIARGYNNSEADSTVINEANMLGVVYATFHSNGRTAEPLLASVVSAVPVALAAPAR